LVVLKIFRNIIYKEFKFVNLNLIFSFAIYLLFFLILKNIPYKKSLIIGLGLLGGSIAKAFKKHNISQNKNMYMKYVALLMIFTGLWMAYEIWRAPLLEETENGNYKTKRPTKKLSDLWRKRN
jgi:hypothetical protein